ncbi:MAG TPA: ATP-binding protein [Thermodesulfobacteriota bacterium]|nr:ATP-binding protein [Thermodesulfobacteriota bacterium]
MLELALHILDVAQNSIEAGASEVTITIDEDTEKDLFCIEVCDNGCGLSEEAVARVLDPFFTTRKTRHVGLGLPLLMEASRRCGGDLRLQSSPGMGTRLEATFQHSHIDRAPLGDMPSVLMALFLSGKQIDWIYIHRVNEREFRLETNEIKKELREIPLSHPKVRAWLLDVLAEGENSLTDGESDIRATA